MEELQKQVWRARRRITLQRFVNVLGWCWFSTLLIAAVLILIDKYKPLNVPIWSWIAGAIAWGIVAALVWTLLVRSRPLEAALEIDRRFGLKERVSSTLAMPPEDLESEAGQTVASDATRRIARLEISEKFPISPPRRLLLPIIPAVLAILVALLPNPPGGDNPAQAKTEDPAIKPQVKKATEAVHRQLAERQEKAKKEGLPEAEQLFKKLEEGTKQMASAPPEREKALSKLNDLSRQLQERRQQIGGAEKVKEQLNQLKKDLQRGPADKFAQALSKGDFDKALEELKNIQKDLDNSKLDEKEKEKLANQLEQMKEKLAKLAEAHKNAQADLQKKAEEMRKAGQAAEAEKLEEQIRQMQNQAPQMQQLQNLANQLGQCAKCLKQGQGDKAAEAMQQAQNAMGEMKKQLEEMEMLDDAMEQLAQAKDKMNCKKCGGMGCEACQGQGQGEGDKDAPPGMGLGKGRGKGPRPEAKTDTSSYDSQVRQKVGRGSATVEGMVEGPNIKGNVQTQIQDQVDSVRRGNTDPLSSRHIPKKYGEQVEEYYNTFREGK